MFHRFHRAYLPVILLMTAATAFAEEAAKPNPDKLAILILTAQRDAATDQIVLANAVQAATQSQKRVSDVIAEVERIRECKIDPRTADCTAKK